MSPIMGFVAPCQVPKRRKRVKRRLRTLVCGVQRLLHGLATDGKTTR